VLLNSSIINQEGVWVALGWLLTIGSVYFWREGKARNKQNESTPSCKNILLADAVYLVVCGCQAWQDLTP